MAKPTNFGSRHSQFVALLAVCGFALAGCRAVDNAQVDVMERELRQQQAYIYELEDYLMQYSDKLRDCRTCQAETVVDTKPARTQSRRPQPTLADDSDIEPLPPQRPAARGTTPRTAPAAPVTDTAPDVFDEATPAIDAEPPAAEPATPPESTPLDAEGFELEIGPTSSRRNNAAASLAGASTASEQAMDEPLLFIPDPASYTVEESVDVAEINTTAVAAAVDATAPVADMSAPEAAAAHVVDPPIDAATGGTLAESGDAAPVLSPPADPARLVAEQLKIRYVLAGGGADSGEAPTSLMVVVEAVNATDEPVDANGEASLMVTRGETRETLQPIERWDFSAEETQAAWQSSQLGDGLHLELPLANMLPEEPVYLWVRLVTSDGKNLRTRVPFTQGELSTLDAALAVAGSTSGEQASEAPRLAAEANSADEQPTTHAAMAAPLAKPTTQWRASTQPLDVTPTAGYAAPTLRGSSGGWAAQPPGGRLPTAVAPRVASAATSDAPPRWQQGSAEPPTDEPVGVWTSMR